MIGEPDYWSHLMKCPDCDIRESDIETIELPKYEPIPPPDGYIPYPADGYFPYPGEWFNHRWEIRHVKPSWEPWQAELISSHSTLKAAQIQVRKIKLKHPRTFYVIWHMRKMKLAAAGRHCSSWRLSSWMLVDTYDTKNFQPVSHIPLRRASAKLPQDHGLERLLHQGERERAKRAVTA